MGYPVLDENGVVIGELTREEMVAKTMADMARMRQAKDLAIAQKARKEITATAEQDLAKLNKHVKKEGTIVSNDEKAALVRAIMAGLSVYPQFLSGNELFVSVGAADYSIKITKKKELVPQLHGKGE